MEPRRIAFACLPVAAWFCLFRVGSTGTDLKCHDWQGHTVKVGMNFVPEKNEPCRKCRCSEGFPIMCTMVVCSPPSCHKWKVVEGVCCEFHCVEQPNKPPDITHSNKSDGKTNSGDYKHRDDDDIANLGLRLAASTVTSFLVLALLLFMVHRLCHKRHLIQMRRLNAPRTHPDDDRDHNILSAESFSIGMPCPPPYEGPPPPYSPHKPLTMSYSRPREAPPPYEEITVDNANHNPAFSRSVSHSSQTMEPSNSSSVQDLDGQPSTELVSTPIPKNTVSIDETAPKTPFYYDSELTSLPVHSFPTNSRPFSTFLGSYPNRHSEQSSQVLKTPQNRSLQNSSSQSCGNIARAKICALVNTENMIDMGALNNLQPVSFQQSSDQLSQDPRLKPAERSEKYAPWYIKRSESIEIKKESCSPQSSYCFRNNFMRMDSSDSSDSDIENPVQFREEYDWLKNQQPMNASGAALTSFKPHSRVNASPSSEDCTKAVRTLKECGPELQNRPYRNASSDLVLHEMSVRPVRISYVDSFGNDTGSRGVRCQSILDKLTRSSLEKTWPGSRETLPPLELEPLQSAVKNYLECGPAGAVNSACLTQTSILSEGQMDKIGNVAKNIHSSNLLGYLQSPDTPLSSESSPSRLSTSTMHERSNSLTSDISMFSICSETGEKKRPKNLSVILKNDVPYPDSFHSSAAPPLTITEIQNLICQVESRELCNSANKPNSLDSPMESAEHQDSISTRNPEVKSDDGEFNLPNSHLSESQTLGNISDDSKSVVRTAVISQNLKLSNSDFLCGHGNLNFTNEFNMCNKPPPLPSKNKTNGANERSLGKQKRQSLGNGAKLTKSKPACEVGVHDVKNAGNMPIVVNRETRGEVPKENRAVKVRSKGNDQCYKQYGFVDDPSVLFSCCNGAESDKSSVEKWKAIDKEDCNNGPYQPNKDKHTSLPVSCILSTQELCDRKTLHSGSDVISQSKKQIFKLSPDHKSAKSSLKTTSAETQTQNSGIISKRKCGIGKKDKNRKSYPGASPELPHHESKNVKNPWLLSGTVPHRGRSDRSHKKHNGSNSFMLDLASCQSNDLDQIPQHYDDNSVHNHSNHLSSYV